MNRTRTTLIALASLLVGLLAGIFLFRPAPPAPVSHIATQLPPDPHAAAASPTTLTVATYNVHNFFDEFDNPYTADEGTGAKSAKDRHLLAATIRTLNADVLILEEIEAGGVLQRFAAEELADCGYVSIVDAPTEDPRGITVAALCRYPVLRITSHRLAPLAADQPNAAANRLARDLLRLDIQFRPDFLLTVYGVHLKSKRTDADANDADSAKRRLAEAARIRDFLREEMPPGSRFLLTGDCNDAFSSPPVQTLLTATTPPLADALASIPPDKRITFHGGAYREAIDHILLSPRLAPDLVPDSPAIFSDGDFPRASDHYPARITLRIP
jgi:endonuclease/exonuclease/phosphatase family metal-dependent hydrolase